MIAWPRAAHGDRRSPATGARHEPVVIERVQRLAPLEHHVVRDVDDDVDRAQPRGLEPAHQANLDEWDIVIDTNVYSAFKTNHPATVERLREADKLAEDGISAEVIDLRTLVPLDMEPVLASVAAILRAMCPDLPMPETMMRPLAASIRSTALLKLSSSPASS